MSKSTLYSFRRCPYAIRARMALHASGIAFETIEVDLKNKPPELIQYSKKGTVPVLVLPDQTGVIDESVDIMLWALQEHDPLGWLQGIDRSDALYWTEENDVRFKPKLDRYKYAVRFPEASEKAYRQDAEVFLQLLEERLSQQKYLLGSRASLADVAVFPFVRQFANVDLAWFEASQYQQVFRWLNTWLESGLFKRVMRKTS